MTVEQIPWYSWVRLAAGLVLFLGPGQLLLAFSRLRKRLDVTNQLIASFGLSVALWAILLSVTEFLNLKITPAVVISLFAFCWGLKVWKNRSWRIDSRSLKFDRDSAYRIFLWIFLAAAFISRLWIIRHQLVGLGSDSYHHTLFTQMIMDQGRVPANYGPGSPIITFTYHFGFHASAAFLGWTSGIEPRLLLLVYGYILVALCSGAVGMAAEKMVGSKLAGTTAAVLTAAFFVFPAYMLLWGRYTQLTGLTLMAIFLGLFWQWIQDGYSKSSVVELGILAAGTGLAHYRIVALTAVGAAILVIVQLVGKSFKAEWKKALSGGFLLILASGASLAPWFIHLWLSYRTGYPVLTAPAGEAYFSILRLGQEAIDYPLNQAVYIMVGISLLIGLITRSKIVLAMVLWAGMALLPSRQILLLDTISVIISLFVPAGIIIAFGVDWIVRMVAKVKLPAGIYAGLPALILLVLSFAGIKYVLTYPVPLDGFVKSEDLKAFEFIRDNLPTDAKFMININRFEFSDLLMIGSDAGYWIPLLTGRQTVVPPMVFNIERVSDSDFPDKLRQLENLNGNLTDDYGLQILTRENIKYVYIGERGGPINPEELMKSPHYKAVYNKNDAYIFEIKY